MLISLIAAVAKNNVIGNKGKIPWHISEDFKHFKEITMGHTIIMGQKTYESIGKPLPGRTNIVLTLDKNFKAQGCIIAYSPDEALQKAKSAEKKEVFIIGGGQVYKTFFSRSDKLYMTKVQKEFEGDTFFPKVGKSNWKKISSKKGHSKEEDLNYEFVVFERKRIKTKIYSFF
jgi:dihydrofolate reductase